MRRLKCLQAMMPSAARFLSLDELDPSTQFCADPEASVRVRETYSPVAADDASDAL